MERCNGRFIVVNLEAVAVRIRGIVWNAWTPDAVRILDRVWLVMRAIATVGIAVSIREIGVGIWFISVADGCVVRLPCFRIPSSEYGGQFQVPSATGE